MHLKLQKGKAALRCLLAVPLALSLLGCRHLAAFKAGSGYDGGGPSPSGPPSPILLIQNPRNVREDVSYPPGVTQQSFHWFGDEAEWRFKLPAKSYGYAGFRFLKPHNLEQAKESCEIVFTISPPVMAEHLWVALLNKENDPVRRMVEVPMSTYLKEGGRKKKVAVIKIPLRDFSLQAASFDQIRGFHLRDEAGFDWQNVREIRFVQPGGPVPDQEIILTGLRIEG